jgi:branched-chain amino acid transport system substrate-binding protein
MKKLLSLVLALAMTASLAACGSSSSGTAAASAAASASTSASTSAAASGDAIKIGLYTPLTGTSAMVGTQEQMGVQLAVKQINDAGGINGKEVSLISYDDQLNAEQAVKAVTRLIQVDKVNAIIGSMSSSNIIATADMIEQAKVLEIGCGTSPAWTNCGYKYIFRGTQNSASFNKGIVQEMTEMGVTKLGTLVSSTEYATNGWADIKKQLASTSIDIALETNYMAGDTDFSGQITKLANAGLDGVLLYGGTEDYGIACKQLRQLGYTGYIYGSETFASSDVRSVAGDAANGAIFACGYVIPDAIEDAATDEEKAFLQAFVDEYGEMPVSDTAYRGYDSMMLMSKVFETAKSVNGDDLRTALLSVDYTGIGGKFDYSDESGDGLAGCGLYAVVDGKNVPFETFRKNIGK